MGHKLSKQVTWYKKLLDEKQDSKLFWSKTVFFQIIFKFWLAVAFTFSLAGVWWKRILWHRSFKRPHYQWNGPNLWHWMAAKFCKSKVGSYPNTRAFVRRKASFRNSSSFKDTIMDKGLSNWDYNVVKNYLLQADVVCAELGFNAGAQSFWFLSSNGAGLKYNTTCNGTEDRFSDCFHAYDSRCSQGVGVICNNSFSQGTQFCQ